MPWFHSSTLYSRLHCIGFGLCCSMSIHILVMSVVLMVHIPLQLMVRIFHSSSLYLKITVILIYSKGNISVSACSSLGSGCPLSLEIIPLKNGILVHLKWHIFYLILCFLNCISASPVSCFHPSVLHPIIRMSTVLHPIIRMSTVQSEDHSSKWFKWAVSTATYTLGKTHSRSLTVPSLTKAIPETLWECIILLDLQSKCQILSGSLII